MLPAFDHDAPIAHRASPGGRRTGRGWLETCVHARAHRPRRQHGAHPGSRRRPSRGGLPVGGPRGARPAHRARRTGDRPHGRSPRVVRPAHRRRGVRRHATRAPRRAGARPRHAAVLSGRGPRRRDHRPSERARGRGPRRQALEIEGLAKPATARLLSLALPGQTLLGRTAYELARRATVGQPAFDRYVWASLRRLPFPGTRGDLCRPRGRSWRATLRSTRRPTPRRHADPRHARACARHHETSTRPLAPPASRSPW